MDYVNKIPSHPEKILTCPYNKAHQIQQYRMHIHLEKCRKQHPDCKMRPCPFNKTHIISEFEMDFHVSSCSDRLTMDREMYCVDNTQEYHHRAVIPTVHSVENWDDDECESYKPEEKTGNHIIRKVKGATPSERRKARMEGVKNYTGGK